jgi:senataxin
MVLDFMREIDKLDIARISSGLDTADTILRALEPKKRGVRILPDEATMAFFEGLSCDAMIRNEEFLQQHFDSPFQLVQTKKKLKSPNLLPSMTRFLFSRNADRQAWAYMSWTVSRRNVLKSEFEWAVRDHLVEAMLKVQINNIDPHLITTFWSGVKLIIIKLDKDLITHSIRGLEGDFYRLILDHLHLPSVDLLDLIATIKMLLEKSPTDFWDAMDAITPSSATIVEQLFGSPTLVELLTAATEQNMELMGNLKEAFSWIPPFRSSIKATNLAQVVRAFVNFLLGRFQSDRFTRASRTFCFKEGLHMLGYAFQQMCERKTSQFVGQPTVNGMLQTLSAYIQPIVLYLRQSAKTNDQDGLHLALSVIQHAFNLETQSLFVERNLISKKEPSPTETPPSSPIWKTILGAIDKENVELATHMLIAGKNLVGLEKHVWTPTPDRATMPPTIRHFNNRYELLSQSITDVINRIAEFDIGQLVALFEQPEAATAIVSSLFSSNEETRSSTVELLKVISSQDERRDALQHLLNTHYKSALQGISDSCRQIKQKKPLTPAPSMIRTLSDIIDVMCNAQDGILRTRSLDSKEAGVTMNLWKNLWDALGMIFETTEAWSNLKVYDKQQMMDLCRDTMQFAEQLFDQCSIFATALKASMSDTEDTKSILTELLALPATTMENMAMWLRLRDEFLSTKSVTLISKLLIRLHGVDIEVDPEALSYIESILNKKIKTKLTPQQQAELQQALETHLGRPIILKSDIPVKVPLQGSISKYISTGSMAVDSKAKDADDTAKIMASMSKNSSAFMKIQEQKEANRARAAKAAKQVDDQKNVQLSEFKKKRQAEKEAQLKSRAAAAAKAKQSRMSAHTAEAGSGLEGLGVLGKDQAPKGEGLMHSSDESDEEGDFDEDLFGIKRSKVPTGPKTNIINEIKIQQPVKKRRIVRSVKDMRARLAPDLSPLHKIILGWDYYHDGDFPPNSRREMYSAVSNTFRTANDYQSTFEPLLTLEAWQGFVKAREENGNTRSYDIKIVTKASVDAFHELSSTMTHVENRELSVSEGDVVLLSKSKSTSAQDPHCLARIIRVKRKQAHIEVSYRVMPSNPLQSSLTIGSTVYGMKIQSITPLEREYGAVLGLQYYDLCDEIIQAKPSPLLNYKDNQLQPLIDTYDVNTAQSKAVKSAMDNDAFTLIQGYVVSSLIEKVITNNLQTARFRKDEDDCCYCWGNLVRYISQSWDSN